MNLTEMVKLGAHGFKPSQIKEIEKAAIKSNEVIDLVKAGYTAEDVDELIKSANEEAEASNPDNKEQPKPEGDSGKPDEANEDKEKKELESKLKEAEDKLKKLQDENASKDLGNPNEKKAEDEFKEALRNLY